MMAAHEVYATAAIARADVGFSARRPAFRLGMFAREWLPLTMQQLPKCRTIHVTTTEGVRFAFRSAVLSAVKL
jgi:hypothetical protein